MICEAGMVLDHQPEVYFVPENHLFLFNYLEDNV